MGHATLTRRPPDEIARRALLKKGSDTTILREMSVGDLTRTMTMEAVDFVSDY